MRDKSVTDIISLLMISFQILKVGHLKMILSVYIIFLLNCNYKLPQDTPKSIDIKFIYKVKRKNIRIFFQEHLTYFIYVTLNAFTIFVSSYSLNNFLFLTLKIAT